MTFDPAEDIAAPFIATGARPRVAILREQGVNGQVEMAAAFDRAGFDAYDVHMSDIIAGRAHARRTSRASRPCGGFSYGDVLGAGEGWAKSILFNARARDEFAAFFARADTFALGVCNGCQMMSNLRELIPGTRALAAFRAQPLRAVRGAARAGRGAALRRRCSSRAWRAAAFRSRSRTAKATPSFAMPRSWPRRSRWSRCASSTTAGDATERYPYNPNGSPQGITGLTTADGRFTILMPHPERVFRTCRCRGIRRSGARTRRGCACSATRARGSDERASRDDRTERSTTTPMTV